MNLRGLALLRWAVVAGGAALLCLAGKPAIATETVQHSFGYNFYSPQNPIGQLAVSGSTLYGVAFNGFNGDGTIFSMSTTGAVKVLYNFQGGSADGAQPHAGPTLVNGVLYGTTGLGGASNMGTIYSYNLSSKTETLLHSFTGTNSGTPANSDGQYPDTALLYNPADGFLYGVTDIGDEPGFANNQGTIYKIKTDGTGYQVIYNFNSGTGSATGPQHALALTPDGYLWGSTLYANGYNGGGVYKVKTDGSGYMFVAGFNQGGSNPYNPASDMVLASDGNLYFECTNGGAYGLGTIEKVVPSTNAVSTAWNFDGYTGAYPYNNTQEYFQHRLFQSATDHNLYGVTADGGAYGLGVAYKFNPSTGACNPLCSFNIPDAEGTANPIVQVGSSFYCTSFYGGLAAIEGSYVGNGAGLSISSHGAIKVIQNFYIQDIANNGNGGGLIQSGSLFVGMAPAGGLFSNGGVYTITASGAYNVIHDFNNDTPGQQGTGWEGSNGNDPIFLNPNDHNIYGECDSGGRFGSGTLWKMTAAGKYTKLHDVDDVEDGHDSPSALNVGYATDKNIYGTFSNDGLQNGGGGGTLWKLSSTGVFTILHQFPALNGQPYQPGSNVIEDSTNTLWGVCNSGGANNDGCIWKISNSGQSFTDVHDFDGTQGANPFVVKLILVGSVLYGETQNGGAHGNGVIWSYNTSTNGYTDVYDLNNGLGDGSDPLGGVIYDSSSNSLYGACWSGGASGAGTVWSYSLTSNTFTLLHAFTGYNSGNPAASDGANPEEGVILGSDGLLHGVTVNGGQYNDGTIFTQTLTP